MTTRREVLRTAALGSLAIASGAESIFGQTRRQPPNILFIMADDLGYADVACYGHPDIKTPNIDRIAARGVRLLQGYSNSPVCSSTRTALITGRYQYRLPVGLEEPIATPGSGGVQGVNDVGLPPEHPTLPSLLRKAGYGTTLVGKWHMGSLPSYGPLKSGYDHFYGFRGGLVDYFNHTTGGPDKDLWEQDVLSKDTGYLTTLLGNRAVRVVNDYAKARKPFLLSLHFNAPHWPWEAPGDEAEAERLRARGKGLTHYDGGSQKTYQQMVEAMDAQIGRVLKSLDDNRLTNNTIVIFTSDNGGERFSNNWPFTGRKMELLEGGVRIPSIISWPERIPRGKTNNQVSISMDWLPTLLAAADVSPDPAYPPDGINLLPFLTNAAPLQPRTLYWRHKGNAQRSIRDGDMKFLKILDNTFLFNVVDDPMERANLKERQKDVYDRLVRKWLTWNATMLPEIKESATGNFTGDQWADHIGAQKTSGEPDNPGPPPN
jgi:arylsulfatase A-like enzyme